MKVLIAVDKFKGSLTAKEVCESLTEGITQSYPNVEIISKPLADGGDGSLEVLANYVDLKTIYCDVHDPLFRIIKTSYNIADDIAYIEMASASGLVMLKENERNPLKTTSLGTGELILDALEKKVKKIVLFIGGSATNDGGIGIAHALGYRFYDEQNIGLEPTGKSLIHISRIDHSNLKFDPSKVVIEVLCDVNNPFYGANGAAFVYAKQKGATHKDVKYLDLGLRNLSRQMTKHHFQNVAILEGAGAAGGVGGGLFALLNAKLVSGIDTFLKITALEEEVKTCDVIITGEGKLDKQSAQGKVVSGVCELANQYQKPVIAVCGALDAKVLKKLSIHKGYSIIEHCNSLEEAMLKGKEKLVEIGASLTFSPTKLKQ